MRILPRTRGEPRDSFSFDVNQWPNQCKHGDQVSSTRSSCLPPLCKRHFLEAARCSTNIPQCHHSMMRVIDQRQDDMRQTWSVFHCLASMQEYLVFYSFFVHISLRLNRDTHLSPTRVPQWHQLRISCQVSTVIWIIGHALKADIHKPFETLPILMRKSTQGHFRPQSSAQAPLSSMPNHYHTPRSRVTTLLLLYRISSQCYSAI
jgi:hypothetical protein